MTRMAEKRLRAVAPDEKPPARKSKAKTVTQAAAGGDERELLVALLARLAVDVENPNTPAVALAALSRRVLEINKDLAALDAREAEEAEGAGANTPDDEWEAV